MVFDNSPTAVTNQTVDSEVTVDFVNDSVKFNNSRETSNNHYDYATEISQVSKQFFLYIIVSHDLGNTNVDMQTRSCSL